MKDLLDESYSINRNLPSNGIPPLFDDSHLLSCLGSQSEAFNEAFSWHQIILSQACSGMFFHMDDMLSHFWALQLTGSKSWVFCPQESGEDLYFGAVDPFNNSDAARAKHTRYEEARKSCYRTTVKVGDILYWQSHWWHSTKVFEEKGNKNPEPSVNVMSCFLADDILIANRCIRNAIEPFTEKSPTPDDFKFSLCSCMLFLQGSTIRFRWPSK